MWAPVIIASITLVLWLAILESVGFATGHQLFGLEVASTFAAASWVVVLLIGRFSLD